MLHLYEELCDQIISHLKQASVLATDNYYLLAALWVFHTYLHQQANYSPIISMVADAESGKSRTGKAMIYVAYRGVHLETAGQAHIIRLADNFHASLFIDTKDICKKIASTQSEDVFLGRFERSGTVLRVGKEHGRFTDTELYRTYGPTIIASNVDVDEILETRTVAIPLSCTSKIFQHDLRPDDFLPLKEMLVACRARYQNTVLPTADKPTTGRLGDIMRPLLQIVKLVAPKREREFLELISEIAQRRLVDKSLSLRAQIVAAIVRLNDRVDHGTLGVKEITDDVNQGHEGNAKVTTQRIGRALDSLGFEKCKLPNGNSAILHNDKRLTSLSKKFGVAE